MEERKFNKLNRTFARRIGKTLSATKKKLIEDVLPKYLYTPENLLNTSYKQVVLEVGFGMGEHFVNQINSNPDIMHIGVEVYINGVANVLKQEESLGSNFMIWPDDLDEILENIPSDSLDKIYVLFPDPWHKRRALKKRLFNIERLDSFKTTLKSGGFISFASDIEDYFEAACTLLEEDKDLKIIDNDYSKPHKDYIDTKYHQKAIREGRKPQFVTGKLK